MNRLEQLGRRALRPLKPVLEGAARSVANLKVDHAKVDSRISYPSYKSFDEFIDVDRLKALDGYLRDKIEQHAREQEDEYFTTGLLTVNADSVKKPGSRIIYLSKSKRDFVYMDLDKPELWAPTEQVNEFPLLMDFIATLPFKATARMMIMYDYTGNAVTAHRDHALTDVCHEFVWFRTNLSKPFYMLNHKTQERCYVNTYTAWFDSVNQFHGADAKEGLSLSIRVDGTFTDEFRKKIPVPQHNLASTPSLWGCMSKASLAHA